MRVITEGEAKVVAPEVEIVNRKLPVFYNPVMKRNRDITLLVLKALERKLLIADPLAGSGVRALRILKEVPEVVEELFVNDLKEDFKEKFTENAALSEIAASSVHMSNKDANEFLMQSKAFDYIDIDPFGSPNQFLDTAIKKLRRNGVLAVTATDTAPLCGTYPKACMRKYWAKPLRNHLKHEIGLRILIRKVQLVGAQYDKALIPLVSYSMDHYFRVFFLMQKGKSKVDSVLEKHGMFMDVGPLWLGSLGDVEFLKKMNLERFPKEEKFLSILRDEVDVVGFFDLHELSTGNPPKTEDVLDMLRKKGIACSRTHFMGEGVRAECDEKQIIDVIRLLYK